MNWIKAIFKWLGAGSPKKQNVDYSSVEAMTCLEAFEKLVHSGGKVQRRQWEHQHFIEYDPHSKTFTEEGHLDVGETDRWRMDIFGIEEWFAANRTVDYVSTDWTWQQNLLSDSH